MSSLPNFVQSGIGAKPYRKFPCKRRECGRWARIPQKRTLKLRPHGGKLTQANLLLATTLRWFSSARLAMAFSDVGFHVEAVCPFPHPFEKTSAVRKTHAYHALTPLRSFQKAIASSKPDLVIPCDDLAAEHLHALHERGGCCGEVDLRALIERSIGAASSYPLAQARGGLMAVAHEEGVRVPEAGVAPSVAEMQEWLVQHRFPVVLKANATWGGVGVRIVQNAEDAARAYEELQAPPSMARVVKYVVVDRDLTPVMPYVRRNSHTVTVQEYIRGRDATNSVACWQGKVLAEISLVVMEKEGLTGPSTIVRVISNREISQANRKIVKRLGLSGLYGFDFILEEGTGHAYLVEMNPRATPTSHLALGAGRDLAAALAGALREEPIAARPEIRNRHPIALFPYALEENPTSELLASAYHDVPWNEPRFVLECMQSLVAGRWSYKKLAETRLGMRLRQIALGEQQAERAARKRGQRKRKFSVVEFKPAKDTAREAATERSRVIP